MKKSDVVIIGGGPAGRIIVHTLHAQDSRLSVTLIKDEETNVNRCAVPYGIESRKSIEKFQISNKLVTDFGAQLVIDRVENIQPSKKEVITRNGTTYHFNHLVLATGSRPLIPPIPGVEAKTVTSVRSLEDLVRLRKFAAEGKRAVIVGGGYIGIEAAVVLKKMGLDVAVVEMLPHILMATTEPEFITEVEKTLIDQGITLMKTRKVVAFEQTHNHLMVKFDNGEALAADFVVLSVGVIPNSELASAAGLQTSQMGIITDPWLQTSADGIYACGDCAEKKSFVTGKPARGEFGTNAVFMAKIVAQNILGRKQTFPGVINANATTVFDWSIGSAGLTEKMAQAAGLNTLSGHSEVLDKYPMMDGVTPIRTKLVFDQNSRKLVGGCVLSQGQGSARYADFISFAIQMGATWEDLLKYQYATHPELAAKPSDNAYVFAAKDAARKLSEK